MMTHLGGPESDEQVLRRHLRYVAAREPEVGVFKIVLAHDGVEAGVITYWETDWRNQRVYETGWSVLPEMQGRGIATAAARQVIERVRGHRRHRFLYAYPALDNVASNAICRNAGFTPIGEAVVEFPPGRPMSCTEWRVDLFA
jgi:RimJ/RimL family protein N-acetyltransferase